MPPHCLVISLGAQHFLRTQARLAQSSPVVHPSPSAQLFAQFPLQSTPQQRPPEQAPLVQSWLALQTLASGQGTPHALPHLRSKSLGMQHLPLTQAW